jgi:hypothetical protein
MRNGVLFILIVKNFYHIVALITLYNFVSKNFVQKCNRYHSKEIFASKEL